ncbi:hypothetical protein A3860_32820 [Niastella vici]|uniref:Lysozyme n=1 Tax=Niastella vici TaxID=1703345 RepID=A0A1V9FQD6_9BACT|nr:GH25 family lysozyme [Niastella vici]OQP60599.1 hypothetical protein A3860_32820 [Niastella vici]
MQQAIISQEMIEAASRFTEACRAHYVQTRQLVRALTAEAEQDGVVDAFGAGLSPINSFLLPSQPLTVFIEQLPRRYAAIRELFYGLHRENEEMIQTTERFRKQQAEYTEIFDNNIRKLIRLHDELAGFVKGKNLKPEARDWVEGYFQVFNRWMQQGAPGDWQSMEQQIITPVLVLNKTHSGSPFIHRSSSAALECKFAGQNLLALTHTYGCRLEAHAAVFKRIIRLAGILDKYLSTSRNEQIKYNDRRERNRRRRKVVGAAIGLPALLLLLYFIYRVLPDPPQPAGLITQALPVTTSGSHATAIATADVSRPSLDSATLVCGIDISKYQGNLLEDLKALDTFHFVICKATEGLTLTDNTFTSNWEWLKKARLIRGAYHFYIYGDDPLAQARHFLQTTGAFTNAEMPLILDIEEGGLGRKAGMALNADRDALQVHLLSFLQYLSKQTGRAPIIYTDLSFANTWLHNEAFSDYPLWLAEYTGKPSPVLPWAWRNKQATFWQKSSSYTIDSRSIDYDVFVGTGRELTAFINGK